MEEMFMSGLILFLIILFSFILLIVFFAIFAPIKITIKTIPKRRRSFILVGFSLGGILLYRLALGIYFKYSALPVLFLVRRNRFKQIPLIQKKKKKELSPKLKRLIRSILRAVKIPKLCLRVQLGLEDASLTAKTCGWLQIAYSIVICLFKYKVKEASLRLIPKFDQATFRIKCFCIIKLKIADIIRESITHKGGGFYASNRKYFTNHHV